MDVAAVAQPGHCAGLLIQWCLTSGVRISPAAPLIDRRFLVYVVLSTAMNYLTVMALVVILSVTILLLLVWSRIRHLTPSNDLSWVNENKFTSFAEINGDDIILKNVRILIGELQKIMMCDGQKRSLRYLNVLRYGQFQNIFIQLEDLLHTLY